VSSVETGGPLPRALDRRRAAILAVVSLLSGILLALAWAVTFVVAMLFRGGHPPLSAYFGMVAILAGGGLGPLGLLAGIGACVLARRAGSPPPRGALLGAALGVLFTAASLVLLLRR
jgi:hypothetical protein